MGETNQGTWGRPRPEQRPYAWADLSQAQKRVVKDALEIVANVVELAGKDRRTGSSERDLFDWFRPEPERRSNVVLIDGKRGSGKTAALMTLVQLWADRLATGTDRAGQGVEIGDPEALRRVEETRGRVVPLPALDLQPQPEETRLLTWITSRFHQLVTRLESPRRAPTDDDEHGAPAPWHPAADNELRSRTSWRRLMTTLAEGWNRNLSQRAGQLDPETFAAELEQAEQRNLELTSALGEAVEAILDDLRRLHPRRVAPDACLVLAIDDADMNPHFGAELLRILPSLWHPRLIVILTGDIRLFMTAMQNRFFAQIQPERGALGEREAARLRGEARKLAANMIDKVIPPAQRLHLDGLSPDERLEALRGVLDAPLRPDAKGEAPPRYASLAGYFEHNRLLCAALPARHRWVRDWQAALSHASMETPAQKLVAMRDLVLDARGLRASEVARVLRRDVQLHRDDGPRGWFAHLPYMRVTPRWRIVNSETEGLRLIRLDGMDVEIPVLEDAWERLGEQEGALLLAMQDVRVEQWGAAVEASWAAELGRQARFAVYFGGSLGAVPWPAPDKGTTTDYAVFSAAWEHYFASSTGPRSATEIAQVFLELCPEVFGDDRGFPARWHKRTNRRKFQDLASLGARMGRLANRTDARNGRQKGLVAWARSGGVLLAAPESGLPAQDAGLLLDGWAKERRAAGKGPEAVREEVTKARVDRADRVLRWKNGKVQPVSGDEERKKALQAAETKLAEIDEKARAQEHPWTTLWEGAAEQR